MSGKQKLSDGLSQKILVVDDDHRIADLLAATLRMAGYEAAAVYSGAAGIERSSVFRPDLVISDIAMPGLDGIDAAKQIISFLPRCRILFFSGDAGNAAVLEKAKITFGQKIRLLQKPMPPDQLLDVVLIAIGSGR